MRVEPGAEAGVVSGCWIDEFAIFGHVRHRHVEHAVDARQARAEKSVDQGDAGVLLAHAFGHEHLVASLILAGHTGFDGALDGSDQFRGLDDRKHLAGDSALLGGLFDGLDFHDVVGEAEDVEGWRDEVAKLGPESTVGAAESGQNDLRATLGIGVAGGPDAKVGATGGDDAGFLTLRPFDQILDAA